MSDINELLEYLAAAVVRRMLGRSAIYVDSSKVIQYIFQNEYEIDLEDIYAELTSVRLEQMGFVEIIRDQYAGNYFIPKTDLAFTLTLNENKKDSRYQRFNRALSAGSKFLSQVFSNQLFWDDLKSIVYKGNSNAADDIGVIFDTTKIPASDRVVSLTHNQQLELEEASNNVIDELSKENSIDGDIVAREQILGQLRAGRELIRAQFVKVWLLEQTVYSVLNSIVERYGEKLVGELAKKLLDRLVDYVFGK